MLLHNWETLSEHNLSIMTHWGKHKTVILLALKHSIIQKTWSIICSSLAEGDGTGRRAEGGGTQAGGQRVVAQAGGQRVVAQAGRQRVAVQAGGRLFHIMLALFRA